MSEPLLSFNHVEGKAADSLLLLHGFLGCKEDWSTIVTTLGEEISCLTVDLPGHGQTAGKIADNKLFRMAETAGLLIELLDHLEINRCHVVGYSMGGRLALYLALHYPNRFSSLIVESATAGIRTEPERAERRARDAQLAETIRTRNLGEFLDFWYSQPLFATLDRSSGKYQDMLKRRLKNDRESLARSLEGMGTGSQPDLWDRLPELKLPVLFVTGASDWKFQRIAAEMANLCPHGEVAIMAGTGHNVHFEAPEQFALTVSKFFKSGVSR